MKNNKRIILLLIVLIELIIGYVSIVKYHQNQAAIKEEVRSNKIAIIDKKGITQSQDQKLKYYWTYDPNQVIEDSPDWLDYTATYHINQDGLNDLTDYSVEKPKNTYRIITLGDSFTFGHFVNTEDNWPEQLEIKLNQFAPNCKYDKFEVINLGMPGYDVPYIVKRYQDIGIKYNPDLILWFESDSGFSRFKELMKPIMNACEEDQSNDSLIGKKQDIYYCHSKALNYINDNYEEKYLNNILLEEFSSFFNSVENEAVVIFYYQNMWEEKETMIQNLRKNYPHSFFETLIPSPSEQEKLPDGHPNKTGHKDIVEFIFNYLKNSSILCNI